VHTSSIARFGGQGPNRRATEESPFALGRTGDVYSRSKAEAHEVAERAARRGQDVVIVAPCGPIGPGDVGPTPTGRLLLTVVTLPFAVVTRTASSFAHVRDMARAHVAAAMRGERGETYLLGSQDVELAELARMAQRVCGLRRPIVRVPFRVASVAGHAATIWARRSGSPPLLTPAAVRIARLGLRADCTKAERCLGMERTPIEAAVRDAILWFAREGYLDGYLRRDPRLRERLARHARYEPTSAEPAAALG
jgi:dihydroflavonol-4-reductase